MSIIAFLFGLSLFYSPMMFGMKTDMEFKISPWMPEKYFEGDGGWYDNWLGSELIEAKVGAARLFLKPRGFAFPHYVDSSKIGYVQQGNGGTVGIKIPNTSEEKVLSLKKGDTISIPSGLVSWWYNSGDSDLVVVYLGETSKARVPGEITYQTLSGPLGILSSFSNEFIGRAYEFSEDETNKLANSQRGDLMIKLDEGKIMPQPSKNNDTKNIFVFSIDDATPDIDVKNGGVLTTLTENKLPILGELGLSASVEKLDANAMSAPFYFVDSAIQVTYVVRGSGHVQILGIGGKLVWDGKVEAGHLFVVPSFFVVAKIADGEGMECFSIMTTLKPVIEQLGGKTSVWAAISPTVLQASLNITSEFEEYFMSKINNTSIFIPPKN